VGARRPTISAALGDLARTGELVRRADQTWVVREPEPEPKPDLALALAS
jgi:hypothetical protein